MEICEAEAAAHDFRRVELMATLAGVPLYRARGYRPIGSVTASPIAGVVVPLIHMDKDLGDPGNR